jgi:hypothetical protein
MGKQGTFASMAWDAKGKVTRREGFLAEMDGVIPEPTRRLVEGYFELGTLGRIRRSGGSGRLEHPKCTNHASSS